MRLVGSSAAWCSAERVVTFSMTTSEFGEALVGIAADLGRRDLEDRAVELVVPLLGRRRLHALDVVEHRRQDFVVTSIMRSASSAMWSESAATTAIGAPTSKTSSQKRKRSAGRCRSSRPCTCRAGCRGAGPRRRRGTAPLWLVSMLLDPACGCGLSSVFMNTMPGWLMCSEYWPAPVTWPKPCMRGAGLPMMLERPVGDGSRRRRLRPAPRR